MTAGQPETTITQTAPATIVWTPIDAEPTVLEIREWPNTTALNNDTPNISTVNQAEVIAPKSWDNPDFTVRWPESELA